MYGCNISASLWRAAFAFKVIKQNNIRFREDIRKAEDTLFYSHFIRVAKSAYTVDAIVYNYNKRAGSLTSKYIRQTQLGFIKGLSIVNELIENANNTRGIDKSKVSRYKYSRYISIGINYVFNLCDSRSNLSISKLHVEISKLYTVKEFIDLIQSMEVEQYKIPVRQAIERKLLVTKSVFGLIIYGKIFHLLKRLKFYRY